MPSAHHPLRFARVYRRSAEGGRSGKVCEIADVPASFKSDMWKYFGFPVAGNKKVEKGTKTNTHLQYLVALTTEA